jgi:hypothetical protein
MKKGCNCIQFAVSSDTAPLKFSVHGIGGDSMAESPKTILDYCEIKSRKDFDPECGISVENIASLVTDYHFASNEEFPCQVERDGKRCEEDHRNGWLGRRKDDERH